MSSPSTTRRAGLSADLWDSVSPTYEAIIAHPFLNGLQDGSLPVELFRSYVIQDSHYLRGFSRALALTGARARNGAETLLFTNSAANAIAVEQAVHAEFAADLGLDPETAASVPLTPTTTAYVDFILAHTSTGSFPEAVASVLACYWIYLKVGHGLVRSGSEHPLYQRWISTYASEQYAETVERVLDIVDDLGTTIGPADRASMLRLFAAGCRYEWMFWDAAWRSETWPV